MFQPLKSVPAHIPKVPYASDSLVETEIPKGSPVRAFYLRSYATSPPPVISSSEFVPLAIVEHLMRNKRNSAIGAKFVEHQRTPHAITNMEGAIHTFVTPLAPVNLHGEYEYRMKHDVTPFENSGELQRARLVLLSALVQPDFEDPDVMLRLSALQETPVLGKPIQPDFRILDVLHKQDAALREAYDEVLRSHMIYHLVASHALPSISDVITIDIGPAYTLLEHIADGSATPDAVRDVFVRIDMPNVPPLALEVLFMTAYHQLRNELSALEGLCVNQGYVYTNDPANIFARQLGDATLYVRCQAAALRTLVNVLPTPALRAMRAYAFNDYADRDAVGLFTRALMVRAPHVAVVSKASLFCGGSNGRRYEPTHDGMKGAILVLHNNSDAFGQNIETEGSGGSLDGAIGTWSSAAASLHRQHPHLLDYLM